MTVTGVAAFVAAGLVLVGCGSSTAPASSRRTRTGVLSTSIPSSTTIAATTTIAVPVRKVFAPGTFDSTDAALEERVHAAGLSGGMIRIVGADGALIHEHTVGDVSGATPSWAWRHRRNGSPRRRS